MMHMVDIIGAVVQTVGGTLTCTMSHPATIHMHAKSPKWSMERAPGMRNEKGRNATAGIKPHTRRTASFKYVGPTLPDEQREAALRLWTA